MACYLDRVDFMYGSDGGEAEVPVITQSCDSCLSSIAFEIEPFVRNAKLKYAIQGYLDRTERVLTSKNGHSLDFALFLEHGLNVLRERKDEGLEMLAAHHFVVLRDLSKKFIQSAEVTPHSVVTLKDIVNGYSILAADVCRDFKTIPLLIFTTYTCVLLKQIAEDPSLREESDVKEKSFKWKVAAHLSALPEEDRDGQIHQLADSCFTSLLLKEHPGDAIAVKRLQWRIKQIRYNNQMVVFFISAVIMGITLRLLLSNC